MLYWRWYELVVLMMVVLEKLEHIIEHKYSPENNHEADFEND